MQNYIISAVSVGVGVRGPGSQAGRMEGLGRPKRVLAGRGGIATHSQLLAKHGAIVIYGGRFGPELGPRNALPVAKMKLMRYVTLYISQLQPAWAKQVINV